ncbi:MAG: hypothetical protein IJS32_08835 [Kiritimatiellae bacterium]|nr:hypothetical protein [Kiritimatiellia bacterium]
MNRGARGTRSAVRGGERGSILLEAVLVLPVYLMVLGCLFIMGDLARGRVGLLEVERFLTWIGEDRFAGHDAPSVKGRLAAFFEGDSSGPADVRLFSPDDGGIVFGSHWASYVLGYGILNVPVPWWFGMANAEQVSRYGNADGELTFRDNYLLPGRGKTGVQIHWRSALFRRLPAGTGGNRYNRDAPVEDLLAGVVWNVIGDTYCGLGAQEEREGVDPAAGTADMNEDALKARKEYVRVFDLVTLGE